jgi:hypothetical protein
VSPKKKKNMNRNLKIAVIPALAIALCCQTAAAQSVNELCNIIADPANGPQMQITCPLIILASVYFPTNHGFGGAGPGPGLPLGSLPAANVAFSELIAITSDPANGTTMQINCPVIALAGVFFQTNSGLAWLYPGQSKPAGLLSAPAALAEVVQTRSDPALGLKWRFCVQSCLPEASIVRPTRGSAGWCQRTNG